MNLDQMGFRCPDARVIENVKLQDYRLAFCGRPSGGGVATILPEKGSIVEGVLWKITAQCEASLDYYEGYPHLYGKERILVQNEKGVLQEAAVYTMNAPYKDCPAVPADVYLRGILEGCRQNNIPSKPAMEAVKRAMAEIRKGRGQQKKTGKDLTR